MIKKAIKLNINPPSWYEIDRAWHSVDVISNNPSKPFLPQRKMICAVIEIDLAAPVIADWVFIAKLDHRTTGDAPLISSTVDFDAIPDRYLHCEPNCDHCEKQRNRNTTVILKHVSGEYKQVGSTCVDDFVGDKNSHSIAGYYAYYDQLCRFDADIQATLSVSMEQAELLGKLSLSEVMTLAAMEIRRHGYLSKNEADYSNLNSTASEVKELLFNTLNHYQSLEHFQIDQQKAQNVIDWVRSSYPPGNSSVYWHNLKTICSSDDINFSHIGLAISAIPVYDRAIEMENSRIHQSQPVGTPGEKIIAKPVFYNFAKSFESTDYRGDLTMKWVANFTDEEGNDFSWFTDRQPDIAKKQPVHISGTIKGHKDYKNGCQTQLIRVTIHEEKLMNHIKYSHNISNKPDKLDKKTKQLLNGPVYIDAQDLNNFTALKTACSKLDTVLIKQLLEAGASPAQSKELLSPSAFMFVIPTVKGTTFSDDQFEILQLLLAIEPDGLHEKNVEGVSPWDFMTEEGKMFFKAYESRNELLDFFNEDKVGDDTDYHLSP